MNKLMLKIGLGVVAAGTLAGAGYLAVGSGTDTKPGPSVTGSPAPGSNAAFDASGQNVPGSQVFDKLGDCLRSVRDTLAANPGIEGDCRWLDVGVFTTEFQSAKDAGKTAVPVNVLHTREECESFVKDTMADSPDVVGTCEPDDRGFFDAEFQLSGEAPTAQPSAGPRG